MDSLRSTFESLRLSILVKNVNVEKWCENVGWDGIEKIKPMYNNAGITLPYGMEIPPLQLTKIVLYGWTDGKVPADNR